MFEYINNEFVWRRRTTQRMGKIFAEIELLNGVDVIEAQRHIIGEDEIRRISIRPQVDTGADYICINENIQEILKIPFLEFQYVTLADGQELKCEIVEPIVIKFENKRCTCSALVLPGGAKPLLGLFPLESMDLIIDPSQEELAVKPPGATIRL